MTGKIRRETNLDEVGNVEQIVANMKPKEITQFIGHVYRRLKSRPWCSAHEISHANPDIGLAVVHTYYEVYMRGEDQSR